MGLIFDEPDLFGYRRAIACGDGTVCVRAIAKDLADHVIRTGHYSRSVAWASSEHFGVYAEDELIGAIQYGPAMNPASGARVVANTQPGEWLELNRMWLADNIRLLTQSARRRLLLPVLAYPKPGHADVVPD